MVKQISQFMAPVITRGQMLKRSTLALIITVTSAVTFSSDAVAGELYRNQQTIRRQTGLGGRRILKSTKAQNFLNRVRESKVMNFDRTSPYEARMVAYDQAMRKYERDYAKWEYKSYQNDVKQQSKLERDRQRQLKQQQREQQKLAKAAAREQERLERKKRRSEKPSNSFFGRTFGGTAGKDSAKEESADIIQDDKAKRAEAFFGNVEQEPVANLSPKPKKTFWQRLKQALFGGA
jgi:hypothetical protein